MKRLLLSLLLSMPVMLSAGENPAAALQASILQRHESPLSVSQTASALRTQLESRGITVFALIDHAAAAEKAGVSMPPTQVLVFGNPRGGTPLMLAHPDLALDLPVRVLIRQNTEGRTEVLWRDAEAQAAAQGLPADALAPLAQLEKLLKTLLAQLQ
ncbi:hypothetical protein CO615_10895 [Lysobacteraceae bacterium NML75-0749]|nr:hypothetical protein CO615_10895 [Xanthomonadaceae bacterium NML75-0749]PJK03710.1 hypothetical protein CO609_07100 [Xanthomonadaceae bacterium NML91-0268]